jgi:hypothetical protein
VAERRVVRATPDFFALIDAHVGDERGPNDESTSAEFEAYELLAIIDRFATGWDGLPEQFPSRPEYRLLISVGRLVPMVAVVGQLAPDGAIELIDITIELHDPWR